MKFIKFTLIIALLVGVAVTLLLIPSPAPIYAAEITLNSGTDYDSFFLDAGSKDALLTEYERSLIPGIKIGSDQNIQISKDLHHATLTNNQTVYFAVRVKPPASAKVDYTTFILKTTPYNYATSLSQNYFDIRYVEGIAGGTSMGDTFVRSDTTKGKAFQVITPVAIIVNEDGTKLYLFSFTAVVTTGGIKTDIETHFSQEPGITTLSQYTLISGCNHTNAPLPCVPTIDQLYSYFYGYGYISPWTIYNFRCYLAAVLKYNTDPLVNVDGTPSPNIYTLTIYGKQLPTPLAPADITIGQPNNIDTEVLEVLVSTIDHVTIKLKFKRTATGHLDISIKSGEGTITASNLLTAIKFIINVNDTTVNKDVFGGGQVAGTTEALPITEVADEIHKEFPCILQQCLNLRPPDIKLPTELATYTTGAGYGANLFSFIDRGKTAGEGTIRTSAKTSAEGTAPETVACTVMERSTMVDLATDLDNNGTIDRSDSPEEQIEIEKKEDDPGAFICENDDDDNTNEKVDKEEVFITGENDLKKVKITLEAIDTEGTVKLRRSDANIWVWSHPEKDLYSDILTGSDEMEEVLNLSKFTVADGTYTMDVWVEGYTPGESIIALEYIGGGQSVMDGIKITVVDVDIDNKDPRNSTDFLYSGGIDTATIYYTVLPGTITPKSVTLKITDISNTEIRGVSLPAKAGTQSITWDGKDKDGNLVGSGFYTVTIYMEIDAIVCKSNEHQIIVGEIAVTLGLTQQLNAIADPNNAKGLIIREGVAAQVFRWSTTGDNGRIEGNGLFRAIHISTPNRICTVTATLGERTGTATVYVMRPEKLGDTHNEVDNLIIDAADKHGMPPQLIKAQIRQESGGRFDPKAYRYEPRYDHEYLSYTQYLLTTHPYDKYRMATPAENGHDALPQGVGLANEDIAPRNKYVLNDANGNGFISAYELIAANPRQNWPKPAHDFTAQTTIASSYGYMQIMWPTAISPMGWNNGNGGPPHLLLDPKTNIDLGVGYDKRKFQDTGNWDDDWRKAIAKYNPGDPKYSDNVLRFVKDYMPKPEY